MAFERIPSGAEWIEICETEDRDEQNRKLRNYICDLEERVHKLENQQNENKDLERDIANLVTLILKSNIFREYMWKHDRDIIAREHSDYSGLQGGE